MSSQGNNINLLKQLPFYGKRAFKRSAETYEVEIINNKNLSDSLFVSKNSIKNLFGDLSRERRGFKYITSVKITLKKRLNDNEFIPRILYFNSLVKTIINRRYHLNDTFEEILNLLDICINESTACSHQIERLYINVGNYEPLSGSSYIPLPKVLSN